MSNSRLYGIWKQRLEQLLPDKCASRVLNMLWLMMGMYQAQTVYLTQIARKLPLRAQKLSLDKRLRRFLANEAVDVRAWYHPWADWLIRSAASGGSVHLIIDTSKVSSGFRKISVAVAYRRRALLLMWDWVPYARGHCTVQQQISLLQQMAALLPAALRLYRRRMWIEEMFGDMKGHGFDLEASCLRHADRLSRLTLAVCILYLWLVALGEHVLCHRLQAEVDRADRCDLSIFRLGWDWLERRLALDDPIPPLFRPNFCLVSGG